MFSFSMFSEIFLLALAEQLIEKYFAWMTVRCNQKNPSTQNGLLDPIKLTRHSKTFLPYFSSLCTDCSAKLFSTIYRKTCCLSTSMLNSFQLNPATTSVSSFHNVFRAYSQMFCPHLNQNFFSQFMTGAFLTRRLWGRILMLHMILSTSSVGKLGIPRRTSY